jgi:hypothetical protein
MAIDIAYMINDLQYPLFIYPNCSIPSYILFSSMYFNRMLTALLCASSSSTFANCITAPPTFRRPCGVRFELVMCFKYDPRLTPEYCLAYP